MSSRAKSSAKRDLEASRGDAGKHRKHHRRHHQKNSGHVVGLIANHTASAEEIAVEAQTERLASLESRAFDWIARGHEANLELGRIFAKIKVIVGHGNWEQYFMAKFAPRGVSLRSGQEFMRLAATAAKGSQNAGLAHFPTARDAQAREINDATEGARAEIAEASQRAPKRDAPKHRVRLDGIYRLGLWLSGGAKDSLDLLRESEHWLDAQSEIVDLLQRLFIKFGITSDTNTKVTDKTPQAATSIRRFPR